MSDAVQIAKITAITVAVMFFGYLAYESNQFEKVVGAVLFVVTPIAAWKFQQFQSTQTAMKNNQDAMKENQKELQQSQNDAAKKAKEAADTAVSVKQVLAIHNANVDEKISNMTHAIDQHGETIKRVETQTNGMSKLLQDQAEQKGKDEGYEQGTADAKIAQAVKDAMIPKHD